MRLGYLTIQLECRNIMPDTYFAVSTPTYPMVSKVYKQILV